MKRKMVKQLVVISMLCFMTLQLQAQVTIGINESPHSDALLDLKENTNGISTKGLLLPRVRLLALDNEAPLSTHVKGMLVYNTANVDRDVFEGCYYNDGTQWIRVGAGAVSDVALTDLWQASAGWSTVSQELRCYGNAVNFIVKLQRTGPDISIWNAAHNSSPVATMVAGTEKKDKYKPFFTTVTSQSNMNMNCLANFPARSVSTMAECEIDLEGTLYIQNVMESAGTFMNRGTIVTGDVVVVSGSYFIKASE